MLPNDRERFRALVDKSDTLQVHSARSENIGATITIDGPYFPYAGRVWDGLFVTVTTAGVAGTDTLSFQPQYHLDGATYQVGKARSTLNLNLPVGRAFRCHEDDTLDFGIPKGATLSVRVTWTAGTLTKPVFSFVTVGGRHAGPV